MVEADPHTDVRTSKLRLTRRVDVDLPVISGQAVLHGHHLFISNLVNGVDQYIVPTMECVKTFPYTITQNYIMQVAVVKETGWIVLGGDNGFARIHDSRTGNFLQRLDHGDCKILFLLLSLFTSTDDIHSRRPCSNGDRKHQFTFLSTYMAK